MYDVYDDLLFVTLSARNAVSKGKPIANNTRSYYRNSGEYIAVKLHNTEIIHAYADGRVQLFTDGWRTVTTKERINRYTGLGIYSHKGKWYIPNGTGLFNDQPIEFEEGIILRNEQAIESSNGVIICSTY